MEIRVQTEDFDPGIVQDHLLPTACGAIVSFVGTVRDFSDATDILALEIEHYPGMTERELERIQQEAARRHEISDSLIIHRYGRLRPQERIVLVVVWSSHRAAAFDACRYLIDTLKSSAPFWKREITPSGSRWVTDCPGCRMGGEHRHLHTNTQQKAGTLPSIHL